MQNIFFDGLHMKGLNIPMSWDSDIGWDVYGKDMEDKDLYSRVAVVFRAVDLNANALSNVPFALVTERGADYDTSADWQNKVGFMPNPRKLFRLWRKSLTMTNAFYGWLERGKPLRYLVPNTIKPDAVSVCTPNGMHAAASIAASQASSTALARASCRRMTGPNTQT